MDPSQSRRLVEEAFSAVARKAIDRKTGVRGLPSIMESILLKLCSPAKSGCSKWWRAAIP
jgi:ATP-dependent protease Clp ATPase subunit